MLVVQFTTNLKSNSFVSHAILSFYSHSTTSSWSLTLLLTSMWPEVRMHTVRALDIISYLNNWVKRTGLHTYKYTLSVAARCLLALSLQIFQKFCLKFWKLCKDEQHAISRHVAICLHACFEVTSLPALSQPFPSTSALGVIYYRVSHSV